MYCSLFSSPWTLSCPVPLSCPVSCLQMSNVPVCAVPTVQCPCPVCTVPTVQCPCPVCTVPTIQCPSLSVLCPVPTVLSVLCPLYWFSVLWRQVSLSVTWMYLSTSSSPNENVTRPATSATSWIMLLKKIFLKNYFQNRNEKFKTKKHILLFQLKDSN